MSRLVQVIGPKNYGSPTKLYSGKGDVILDERWWISAYPGGWYVGTDPRVGLFSFRFQDL